MRNNERLVELWKVSGSFSPAIAKVLGLKGVLEFLIFKGMHNVGLEFGYKDCC